MSKSKHMSAKHPKLATKAKLDHYHFKFLDQNDKPYSATGLLCSCGCMTFGVFELDGTKECHLACADCGNCWTIARDMPGQIVRTE